MKQIILTTLITFQTLGQAVQIHCNTVDKDSLPLNISIKIVDKPALNPNQIIKGTTIFSGPRIYSVHHSNYSTSLFYMRIGYRQKFSTQIPYGPTLHISGTSFSNVGPIEELSGSMTYHSGRVDEKSIPLHCKFGNSSLFKHE